MLICKECGAIFSDEELVKSTENHPYGEGYAIETFYCCPSCKSGDIEEAHQCFHCGEYLSFDGIDFYGGKKLCEVCADDLYG